ncbi:MAG: Rossmann-like and DUF2520 domain-containing protein [Thermodesulfovibrionales bacterium]
MYKVSIIGAGVVGTATGYLLKKNGYSIVGIGSRTIESAKKAKKFIGEGEPSTDLCSISKKADIIFITTPDDLIEKVCNRLAEEKCINEGAVVFHMSGALSSDVLKSVKDIGANVASLHPLQSLASVKQAVKNLPGSFFCIEGDDKALSIAREIVNALRGKIITLKPYKKPLYHGGASVASNFLVATIGFGIELLEKAGIEKDVALEALLPLIKGTIMNIEKLRIPSALTGPISRGDLSIVDTHLRSILKEMPRRLKLYIELARYTVEIAHDKGTIRENVVEKFNSLFDKY